MTRELLKSRQALPLELKETLSSIKIKEYYHRMGGKVYVAFSGGKDSTVLLHLVRSIFPDVEAVFSDTGLEFPEIRDFIKTTPNVTTVKPSMSFKQVIDKYGYPVISKKISMGVDRYHNTKFPEQKELRLNGGINPTSGKKQERTIPVKWHKLVDAPFKCSERCCDVLKKSPFKKYDKLTGKKPFIGTMASDSKMRKDQYLKSGCNSFERSSAKSTPLGFWTEADIWAYIKKYNLDYSDIYNMGYDRTGCIFCAFGVHMEKNENRFQRMEKTHPKLYNYCINKLGMGEVLDYIGISYTSDN